MAAEGMAEQRCPMCGKPNPADATECVHCGARLVPLDLSGADEMLGPSDDQAGAGEDWLARMRGASQEEPAADLVPGELPAWMQDVGGVGETEEGAAPLGAIADEEPQPEGEDAAPEWLQRIRAKEQVRAQEREPADSEWVSRLRGAGADEAARPEHAAGQFEPDSWAQDAAEPVEGEPGREAAEAEQPAPWEREAADAQAEPPEREAAVPQGEERTPRERVAAEPPGWRHGLDSGPAADEEQSPKQAGGSGGLPHVPALIFPEGTQPPSGAGEGEADLPEWLGAITPELEQPLPPAEGEDSRLAPATLPSWLEAMRPVETFRSVVQIESEDDQAVESAGPLAGLRGVLIAEPLVAMPRSATIGAMQLAVSERQYAQAELLHRMVEEEQRELHVSRRPRPQLNVIRWAIAAVMLVATLLPVIGSSPRFPMPSLEPRELGSLFTLIEGLPAERPALLVFDYEPGYSGELEAVGEGLIEQMMARGLPIATMTTRPTGSPLASRIIGRLAERHGYALGENVVHLGYLSGGPTAIQLFSLGPRAAILQGFAMPDAMREAGISAWETPVLQGVSQLSDFSVVAVITAGTETARAWAEQAKANMGDTPLVMVLSAGAEPMVRPYYEARTPRVNGILTGLPAATAYERRIGLDGLSAQRWHAFGSAMLAGELILLVGVGYGLVQWWTGRREK